MKIGVVGFSAQAFNETLARVKLTESVKTLKTGPIEIVSGLTNIGVPKLAYALARRLNATTVGFACSQAEDYDCYPVDKKYIIGTNWGDESMAFLDYIDALVAIGGGKQSLAEIAAFKKLHGDQSTKLIVYPPEMFK